MNLRPSQTKAYIKAALKDERLRQAVDKATQTALAKRAEKAAGIPYWNELRRQAHAVKQETLEHLDKYLLQFEAACQRNGMIVHWARDAEEARETILSIARSRGVRSVVKSKSLTTEEIHLNHFLINQGIETLETDLGEYIVQLLDQIPSHLTAPALHLTRRDVGRIFHEKLGVPYTEEPTELLRIARAELRGKFLAADMGISGINFAVAENGCLVVLENEANARLTLTIPRIHVAVMGLEKVISSLDDLPIFLKLLPVSATGQKQTVYVNFIDGPLRPRSGEGPEEVHVVILDNGRSRIMADPQLRETLYCIRCGACLNVCPIYQLVGGHAYGWVYMGPIGATLIPQYLGEQEGRYAPYISSLCGACREICPVGIDIPHHLLKLRRRVVAAGRTPKLERLMLKLWAFLAQRPLLYRAAARVPSWLQKLYPRPFPVPGYFKERAIGRFDTKGFRRRFYEWREKSEK